MAATLTRHVLEDQLAVSLAMVLAAANREAHQSGTDATQSSISISQRSSNGEVIWRVNYSAKKLSGGAAAI